MLLLGAQFRRPVYYVSTHRDQNLPKTILSARPKGQVITAANAVCFFSELTKVPHILEPSTTPSDCTGDMPTREALEPKVNVSTAPAPTNSASRYLGADMIDDVEAQREPAREVCERPVSPPPQPQLITEECDAE